MIDKVAWHPYIDSMDTDDRDDMEVAEPQPRPISTEMMAYIKLYLFQELKQQIKAELELEQVQVATQPAPANNDDLLTRIINLGERVVRVEEGLKAVIEQLQTLSRQMDARFGAMQAQMDKRFDAFQTQLDRRFAEQREDNNRHIAEQREYSDKRFEDIIRLIVEQRVNNDKRFAEQREETAKIGKRVSAFGVVIIGLLTGSITLLGIILAN